MITGRHLRTKFDQHIKFFWYFVKIIKGKNFTVFFYNKFMRHAVFSDAKTRSYHLYASGAADVLISKLFVRLSDH